MEKDEGRGKDSRQEILEEMQVMRIQLRLQRVWREVYSEEGTALVNKSQKEGLKEISIASWQGEKPEATYESCL